MAAAEAACCRMRPVSTMAPIALGASRRLTSSRPLRRPSRATLRMPLFDPIITSPAVTPASRTVMRPPAATQLRTICGQLSPFMALMFESVESRMIEIGLSPAMRANRPDS